MQRRGVFINPATHNLQLKNQLCPQLAVPFSETEWKTKCPLEARAYVQEFVYPADQGIKQAFSQAWKRNRIQAHPWPGKNFALWKILRAAGIARYKRRREISINPTQIKNRAASP